jgi:hypothetical protein
VSLIRHPHDYEVDHLQNFLGFLYSQRDRRGQTDRLNWSPTRGGIFTVKYFIRLYLVDLHKRFRGNLYGKLEFPL